MNPFVNDNRSFSERCIPCRNYNRIGEILSMPDDAAPCPTPDDLAFACVIRYVDKFSEISKRHGRKLPPVKAHRWNDCRFQQCFIDCHIHGWRTWIRVLVSVNLSEQCCHHVERADLYFHAAPASNLRLISHRHDG